MIDTSLATEKVVRSIHMISIGPFGKAVAALVKQALPNDRITCCAEYSSTDMSLPDAQIYIVVSWHPVHNLCCTIEKMCYSQKSIFIPAIMHDPWLQVGPIVIPGSGACYSCSQKRFLQHSPLSALYQDIYHYYDEHPEQGPQGFLLPVANLTAMRLLLALETLASQSDQIAGYMWRWTLATLEASGNLVTGVHGCPYCGLQREESTRSYGAMQQSLVTFFRQSKTNYRTVTSIDVLTPTR